MNLHLLPTFRHSHQLSQHISPIVLPVSTCPVRKSPFGRSVAICALLISLPHLSQSVCRPGISSWDQSDESPTVQGPDCMVDAGAPPNQFRRFSD